MKTIWMFCLFGVIFFGLTDGESEEILSWRETLSIENDDAQVVIIYTADPLRHSY